MLTCGTRRLSEQRSQEATVMGGRRPLDLERLCADADEVLLRGVVGRPLLLAVPCLYGVPAGGKFNTPHWPLVLGLCRDRNMLQLESDIPRCGDH